MNKNRKAVAIKYDDGIEVPIIMAKGTGKKADKILKAARENKIPVSENKVLVDFLSMEEEGSQVPEEAWNVLAKIFAFIIDRK